MTALAALRVNVLLKRFSRRDEWFDMGLNEVRGLESFDRVYIVLVLGGWMLGYLVL